MAERPGESHPLLLAPGELGGVVVAAIVEPHPGEQLVGPGAAVLAPQL